LAIFAPNELPQQLCFDHATILADYLATKCTDCS
jgi:hypothetical protein